MNWRSDEWFAKHHERKLTNDFKAWWVGHYGTPEQNDDDQHEYWVRCAFALMGWLAAKG